MPEHTRTAPGGGRPGLLLACLACLALLGMSGCSALGLDGGLPPGAHPAAPTATHRAPAQNGGPYTVADTARSAVGVPYRWGGDSPSKGFDCSGLVYWAFARHGVQLPRPSWAQIRAGTPVGRNELQPGDLVFFKTVRGNAYHVGIYVGGGRFVHSPRSGQSVRLSDMSEGYWRKHYAAARRVPAPLCAER